jgi:hypothetical protein
MKEEDEIHEYRGLRARHVAQIIRRKMIQKDHGDNNKYSRKVKHKNKGNE